MSDWSSEYLRMVEDCEKRSEKLTDWELSFIDSLSRQLAAGHRPSAKQTEILDNVWEKVTAKG